MKQIFVISLLPLAVLLTGCDEQARQFATQTKAILDQRSAQLSKKIAAEMKSYSAYAAKADDDQHSLLVASTANDRAERANRLAADYQEGRKSASLWLQDLSDYANDDYQTTKLIFMTDIDEETNYLKRYQSLAVEQDKVAALAQLLDAMAKKQSFKDEISALVGFAEDTKTEFDKKVCADLRTKTDTASIKLAEDKKCAPAAQ